MNSLVIIIPILVALGYLYGIFYTYTKANVKAQDKIITEAEANLVILMVVFWPFYLAEIDIIIDNMEDQVNE